MPRYRSLPAAVIILALCACAGAYFGHTALSAQDQVSEQYKVFTAGLRAIEDVYVGDVESDRVVYSAITGLLQTLDPHSSFMDPRAYAQTRERQEGRYYGLGITIQVINGDVIIASVFENSPAFESGLRRGDVIARIEREDTKGWTSEQTVGRLKGPRGTFVDISLRRAGYEQLIDLRVRRDEVHIPTVTAAVMLDESTGYIKLTEFAENSDRELGRALGDLTKRGMKRLVFDLRGNPGGALDQAILVSSRFLPKGDLIVYTRGRVNGSDQDYRAQERSDYLTMPMITLVNRSSASASEIVSGALQDHDRSLVIGETTFGKALVQSVYRLSRGAAAMITTARYYTPSGRLIQRPWDGTFDDYLTYTLRDQDANKTHKAEDLKLHRRRQEGVQRRRRRARSALRRSDRGLQPRPLRAHDRRARSVRRLRPAVHASGRHARHADVHRTAARGRRQLSGDRRDARRVQAARHAGADAVRRGRAGRPTSRTSRR